METLPFLGALCFSTNYHINIKNSVSTSKKTQGVSVTKVNYFMLFKKIIDVYSENHVKPINTHSGKNAELLNVKACGIYRCHSALKF
jgi:hypothetical protein